MDLFSKDSDEIPFTGLQPAQIMARLRNRTPAGDTLITKLKDPPIVLFCSIPGRKKELNVFCDSGNSHCLFTKGTQENLYGIKTRKGPQPLGAVGGTAVMGGDTWALGCGEKSIIMNFNSGLVGYGTSLSG